MAQPADPRDDDLVAKFSDPQLAHQFAETAAPGSPPPFQSSLPPLSKAPTPPAPLLLRRPRSAVITVVVVVLAGLAIALLVTYLSH